MDDSGDEVVATHGSADDSMLGPSRRTVLAAERTWLAWWRTGMAVATVSIAVGGVAPRLVETERAPFVVLGIGYALLSVVVFTAAFRRHRQINRAIRINGDIGSDASLILTLTVLGGLLAIATLLTLAFEL
ncbi:MAG: DUF202 domain-containing protein [Actinobacteria bacterium]|nr:DUF202 domain-containing protein [Actinomycetota bacterium]